EGRVYWSSRPLRPSATLDESFLKRMWNDEVPFLDAWAIQEMVALVNGEYRHVSGFYSVPDECAKISKKTLVDVEQNPGKYALVFLDYHN
ncbi:MAG: hypothetical protein ACPLRM_08865, partial [Anaerolineae bacterium]